MISRIRNNKGFGAYEMLIIAFICVIISAIVLTKVYETDYDEHYSVMKYNAKTFGLSATNYQFKNNNNIIYLGQLTDKGLFSKLKNPFHGDDICDLYNSKVEFENDKKYVTLKCGNFMIYHQYLGNVDYKIYRVTEWSFDKGHNDNDEVLGFNYLVKGHEEFIDYYEEEAFLYEFNKVNNKSFIKVSDIPNKYNVVSKRMYRQRTFIKKIKD